MFKIFGGFFSLYFLAMLLACSSKMPTPSETHDAVVTPSVTQASLPSFLQDVYPRPGSQVSQPVYTKEVFDDEENQFFSRYPGSICADLNQKSLLEQNDYNFGDYAARSHLRVSTSGPNSHSVPAPADRVVIIEAGGASFDERNNQIGGTLIVCWVVDLVPDIYEVTYEYTQTSGNVLSYTWSFEITE